MKTKHEKIYAVVGEEKGDGIVVLNVDGTPLPCVSLELSNAVKMLAIASEGGHRVSLLQFNNPIILEQTNDNRN